jgi:putative intracellular protease/amidase
MEGPRRVASQKKCRASPLAAAAILAFLPTRRQAQWRLCFRGATDQKEEKMRGGDFLDKEARWTGRAIFASRRAGGRSR